jgi:hypothetical protein
MIPLAHAGHWALDLLYLAPVVFVLMAIGREKVAQRREEREEREGANLDQSGTPDV